MKKFYTACVTGILAMTMALGTSSPVLAWHPQGKIQKTVQDLTINSQTSQADDTTTALTVHPGDTLQYNVTINNVAQPAANNDNDLAFITISDALPNGIESADSPSERQISENIGTITPGNSVTKHYTVKVTSETDGDIIVNKACFDANSIVKDNPQHGCDVAIVKVSVPTSPAPSPSPTPTPQPPKPTPQATLPNTGIGNVALPASVTAVLAYITYNLKTRRQLSSK